MGHVVDEVILQFRQFLLSEHQHESNDEGDEQDNCEEQ
jgi:hypothetical protein